MLYRGMPDAGKGDGMNAAQNANFEGWSLVELYGHGREAGFVTTQYFGTACMFQVDVPEIPARQETLTVPRWSPDGTRLLPVGTVIEREAIPGRTRLLGVGSIYSMNPATEEAVRIAISKSERREMKVISVPEGSQPALPMVEVDTCEPQEDEEEVGF
jgi:hypothetical protein